MILQGVFQDDRDKVIASPQEINELQARLEQGEGLDMQSEPGVFEGISEAWKGVPAGALESLSNVEEVLANTGLTQINPDRIETESGFVVEDAEKHQAIVRQRLDDEATRHRAMANGRYGIDAESVGVAGQILYGLVKTLPKAVTASALYGPVGGAVAFGADYGSSEYLKLRDEGVEKMTAASVGVASGVAGGLGVLLPATFGSSRLASATIGAGANTGLTAAELGAVEWILENQNYDSLAERYGLNATALITSGVFGGVFGGAMYRPKARTKPEAKQVVPTNEQVAAGRTVMSLVSRLARLTKLASKDSRNSIDEARDLHQLNKAADVATEQLQEGKPVTVAESVPNAEVDTVVIKETRGNFAREFIMGDDDSQAVVLQNRDRNTVASVAQMNRIAAKPDYYLASTSRSLQDGAPIVSFGQMPDNEHLGIADVVVANDGRRIPVQYAVVEADEVLTSNDYLGNANAEYGDPTKVNAIAGNGRVTGIRAGYDRGTAEQYKSDLMADNAHGVNAEVVKAMKKPILVRFIAKNDVTTRLIDESNRQSTLARSPVEQAYDDAQLISNNLDRYQFDDDGRPTEATVRQFVNDINEPNALGRLLTPNGSITPEAVARVQNAVVQAAYGDMDLTQLFAMETKPGAKRLMNAMVALAPEFVEIRKLGGDYDFSSSLLSAFKTVRESMLRGEESVLSSGSMFGDNGMTPFVDILDRNRQSMAGVMRELGPVFDGIRQAVAMGDSMFGDAPMDFADILQSVRRAQNDARLAEGKPLLMDIDPEEIRQGLAMAREAVQAAEEFQASIDAQRTALEGEGSMDTTPNEQDLVARSRAMLTEDADAVRVAELSEEMPDTLFTVTDENGQDIQLSIADIQALNEADLARAETEADSMGEVFACVDLNRGIQ